MAEAEHLDDGVAKLPSIPARIMATRPRATKPTPTTSETSWPGANVQVRSRIVSCRRRSATSAGLSGVGVDHGRFVRRCATTGSSDRTVGVVDAVVVAGAMEQAHGVRPSFGPRAAFPKASAAGYRAAQVSRKPQEVHAVGVADVRAAAGAPRSAAAPTGRSRAGRAPRSRSAAQQVLADAGSLDVGEGAHRVHERAAGLEQLDGRIDQRALHGRQALRGGRVDPPPRVRAAAQRPEAGARRVDEHPVERAAAERRVGRRRPRAPAGRARWPG